MPTYWRLTDVERRSRVKLHRLCGCPVARENEGAMVKVNRHKPALPDELCRYCFPTDPVKALLVEEREFLKAAMRTREHALSLFREVSTKEE